MVMSEMIVPRIVPVRSLVLRTSPWREKDRLVVLLTKERGKVFAIAQGSQVPQNRLASATQIGVIATFWLAKAREFDRVTDYKFERLLARLRVDVFALSAFCLVAELLELTVPAEVPDEDLFSEILWFADCLESGVQPAKWLTASQIRLLWRLGWMPHLLSCALCGVIIESEQVVFAPSLGGAICETCRAKKSSGDAQTFQSTVLQGIYSLWQQPRLMETLQMRSHLWNQALELLRSHWCYYLEVETKSWQVWKQLNSPKLTLQTPKAKRF